MSFDRNFKHLLRVRVKEFNIPPISDGREAPIGCAAFRKALELLVVSPFEHIELDDDVIGDILVRRAFLRRVPQDYLVQFVLQRIKPLMGSEEIMQLDLNAEILIEDETL
ncbi:hypothetical protein [Methylococcus sp. Mc7]|uniref:hypothetical protein n=1 Tax=Methylococcus sp. Mc7 TaxID=2860258 RepID=UPI001C530D27|nr:hypothetical protein [Methylococcus sp. Mc7]QXP84970.1 hypothetical protein KW115_04330 [Methylococcus sp. Mc7]